jgi:hypothetical protein
MRASVHSWNSGIKECSGTTRLSFEGILLLEKALEEPTFSVTGCSKMNHNG